MHRHSTHSSSKYTCTMYILHVCSTYSNPPLQATMNPPAFQREASTTLMQFERSITHVQLHRYCTTRHSIRHHQRSRLPSTYNALQRKPPIYRYTHKTLHHQVRKEEKEQMVTADEKTPSMPIRRLLLLPPTYAPAIPPVLVEVEHTNPLAPSDHNRTNLAVATGGFPDLRSFISIRIPLAEAPP